MSLFDEVYRVGGVTISEIKTSCVDRDVMHRKRFLIKPQVTQAVVVA